MTERQENIPNLLALARVARTEHDWTQFFAIAAAWNKLAIYRDITKELFASSATAANSSSRENPKNGAS